MDSWQQQQLPQELIHWDDASRGYSSSHASGSASSTAASAAAAFQTADPKFLNQLMMNPEAKYLGHLLEASSMAALASTTMETKFSNHLMAATATATAETETKYHLSAAAESKYLAATVSHPKKYQQQNHSSSIIYSSNSSSNSSIINTWDSWQQQLLPQEL